MKSSSVSLGKMSSDGVGGTLVGINIGRREGNLHLPHHSRLTNSLQNGPQPSGRPAVFLDRDGVLIEDVGYLRDLEQSRVLPGVPEALRSLHSRFYIIVVTNQSAIARGIITQEELAEVHEQLVWKLARRDAFVDAIYYCPHLPDSVVDAYSIQCDCRKPKPGMLLQASADWNIDLNRSYMVGDKRSDAEAGMAAGVRSILVGNAQADDSHGASTAPDLAGAAEQVLLAIRPS